MAFITVLNCGPVSFFLPFGVRSGWSERPFVLLPENVAGGPDGCTCCLYLAVVCKLTLLGAKSPCYVIGFLYSAFMGETILDDVVVLLIYSRFVPCVRLLFPNRARTEKLVCLSFQTWSTGERLFAVVLKLVHSEMNFTSGGLRVLFNFFFFNHYIRHRR